jgi:YD repeat-containing protein
MPNCPNCSSEVDIDQPYCSKCGTALQQPKTQADPKPVGMPVRQVILIGVLAVLVIFVSRMYVIPEQHKAVVPPTTAPTPVRVAVRPRSVEHGAVVKPEELQAQGKLYFVPMGKQAISAESLAAYYRQKFNLAVTVLPPLALKPETCVPSRNQCIAEEMIIEAKRAYPRIAHKTESMFIVLTDEDIFPRSLGWEFTYGLMPSAHAAIVATHRMDPGYWGDPPSQTAKLASARQMLTKYVARIVFRVPISYDPTSVMYQPLTPEGGSDDLYESDLHSEESANGLRGEDGPCLLFKYSYATRRLTISNPQITACYQMPAVYSTDEETFTVALRNGLFIQHSMDLQMDSTPPIDFARAYESQFIVPWALGQGTLHRYDNRVNSNGAYKLTYSKIVYEDGNHDYFHRVTPGIGFSPAVLFENRDDGNEVYGARMTWDTDHFKVQYRDGAWSTYLPCSDYRGSCFWTGYQDAQGHSLHFDRGPDLVLQRLTASDGQGIQFRSDDQHHTVAATDTKGRRVSYEYDPAGCLVRVHRADGKVTIYSYDATHHMTQIAVAEKKGAKPHVILTNEYDKQERVIKQVLADGSTYRMQYGPKVGEYGGTATLVDPEGRTLKFTIDPNADGYTERAGHVRFPVVNR